MRMVLSMRLFYSIRPYNKIILLDRVVHTIERHRMFTPGDRVAIAVSGGADSVCLLHVLRNLEQSARNARLAFFHEGLARGLATRIALGHTRSDQAETVLFRFLRGSGATGLAAIRPVTDRGIVRPLIDIERPEIVAFLEERGIAWREDATNATLDFARNRIRHQLLPQLAREWNPALAETLAHTADLSLAEEAYWQAETDRLADLHITRCDGAVLMSAAALAALPLAAGRRLV